MKDPSTLKSTSVLVQRITPVNSKRKQQNGGSFRQNNGGGANPHNKFKRKY